MSNSKNKKKNKTLKEKDVGGTRLQYVLYLPLLHVLNTCQTMQTNYPKRLFHPSTKGLIHNLCNTGCLLVKL